MEVKLTNGEVVWINLKKYIENKNKSNFQSQIREELKTQYPNDIIFEEVFIPIERFYLDLFIPTLKLVIEVNGKQHKQRIKFFHRNISDFNKQKETDERKRNWCKLNNFRLIEINA